ncbi:Glycine-rich RNA-binding protein 8 [Raphanus sativus]|uniref:Glycine-rich RNA-binding protein GRP2A-like n=1 Tax=Raphanus sativus TaxID=3726 RepID=A0A6J0JKQ8_RAPSA|nr:glycine-rich RNA-binding protein GRP2A-like [Raphanus sativus]KAJ4890849.1 Glycine-rich RNA-binding protein 8 [Raphanus sativus]
MASPNVEFKCYVGGFDHYTDEKDLERAFSKFGDVIDSKIIRNHVTGISRNFGFITFKDEKSMRDAIEEMNGRKLDGNKVDTKDVKFECVVGNLAECTTEKDLERGFSLFGEVIDSEIVYDTETHKSRRFGYVTFKDEESMRNAQWRSYTHQHGVNEPSKIKKISVT